MEKKSGKTQVSILLTILGESAQQIYDNMDIEKTEKEDINAVLKKLEEYIESRVNTIYER